MGTVTEIYKVVWPRGASLAGVVPAAKRPPSLEGKTVAFLWDFLFRGDQVFKFLQKGLAEKFPGVKFVGYEVFGNTHSGDERKVVAAVPGRLKEHRVDAVISGMGC